MIQLASISISNAESKKICVQSALLQRDHAEVKGCAVYLSLVPKSPSVLLTVRTAQPTGTEVSANVHLLTHKIPSSRDKAVGLQPHGGEQPHGGIDSDGKSRPTTGKKAGEDPGH